MTKLKPGDRIDCRVKSAAIVSPYHEYDEVMTFEIVASDNYGYYLYVPHYIYIKGCNKADKMQCRHLSIDKKFLDENIVYINATSIARVVYVMDGMSCRHCKEFYPMAEANQEDGTLLCYSCRQDPYVSK